MAETDIRALVPRVRRALGTAGASMSDDAVRDATADALADVLLYVGSIFGKTLLVTEKDEATGAPLEYATSDELTLPEASVIAAQAALNHFFHAMSAQKISERMSDEGRTWEWSQSAQLLTEQFRLLVRQRDDAVGLLQQLGVISDAYVSFLAVRDVETARLVEPWSLDGGGGGLELVDYRFGG